MKNRIDVIMSSYNGEKYISSQIDSLLAQSFTDFRVFIRDDGSQDETCRIVKRYAESNPRKIYLVEDDLGNLGSCKSFMQLLKYCNGNYIMLADQDDVWLPGKMEITYRKMREMESIHGDNHPLLVFTDLIVTDDNLKEVASSFWDFHKIDVSISQDWRCLVAQNVVTGCTVMLNSRAKDISLPMPDLDMLHDQWLAINVAKNGSIGFVCDGTIYYRQHSSNVEGARDVGLAYMIGKLKHIRKRAVLFAQLSRIFGIGFFRIIYLKFVINIRRLMS